MWSVLSVARRETDPLPGALATGQFARPDTYFSQTPEGSFMSRSSDARSLLTCLVLCALLALSPHAAQTPRDATSADARLRALYTEEWNWRQQELARTAISTARRRERPLSRRSTPRRSRRGWPTGRKTLATLDGIPFDQLSPEEKVNAQVFRTSIRALANDVRFRTYEAPFNSDTFFWTEFTPRQGFATAGAYRALSAAPPRRAALLRRADRQHARRPRARLHACRACRSSGATRRSSRT